MDKTVSRSVSPRATVRTPALASPAGCGVRVPSSQLSIASAPVARSQCVVHLRVKLRHRELSPNFRSEPVFRGAQPRLHLLCALFSALCMRVVIRTRPYLLIYDAIPYLDGRLCVPRQAPAAASFLVVVSPQLRGTIRQIHPKTRAVQSLDRRTRLLFAPGASSIM